MKREPAPARDEPVDSANEPTFSVNGKKLVGFAALVAEIEAIKVGLAGQLLHICTPASACSHTVV